jgi:hypothetical protein
MNKNINRVDEKSINTATGMGLQTESLLALLNENESPNINDLSAQMSLDKQRLMSAFVSK